MPRRSLRPAADMVIMAMVSARLIRDVIDVLGIIITVVHADQKREYDAFLIQ